MPTYEYDCRCGASTELYVSLKDVDKNVPSCEKCGQQMMRVISRSSFSFKGGGWARDGYSKDKPR